jgi:hypothetical protein
VAQWCCEPMALPWHLESLNRIWLGVVFTDCAFSHSGVLLGFGVQRFGIRYCMFALSRLELTAPAAISLRVWKNGPGRDDGCPSPPGQIRTCGTTAYGSYRML